jgi:hypothetical protein
MAYKDLLISGLHLEKDKVYKFNSEMYICCPFKMAYKKESIVSGSVSVTMPKRLCRAIHSNE